MKMKIKINNLQIFLFFIFYFIPCINIPKLQAKEEKNSIYIYNPKTHV